MPERRPYAVAVYKGQSRVWMGFHTREDAATQRRREQAKGHKVSPVIHLYTRR